MRLSVAFTRERPETTRCIAARRRPESRRPEICPLSFAFTWPFPSCTDVLEELPILNSRSPTLDSQLSTSHAPRVPAPRESHSPSALLLEPQQLPPVAPPVVPGHQQFLPPLAFAHRGDRPSRRILAEQRDPLAFHARDTRETSARVARPATRRPHHELHSVPRTPAPHALNRRRSHRRVSYPRFRQSQQSRPRNVTTASLKRRGTLCIRDPGCTARHHTDRQRDPLPVPRPAPVPAPVPLPPRSRPLLRHTRKPTRLLPLPRRIFDRRAYID